MISILHSNNTRDTGFFKPEAETESSERFTFDEKDIRKAYKNKGYDFVALIDTNDLDEAYKLSNNITSTWAKGEKVNTLSNEAEERGGARSSMVGDIFGDEDDNYYVVSPYGFTKIGKLPHPATI